MKLTNNPNINKHRNHHCLIIEIFFDVDAMK